MSEWKILATFIAIFLVMYFLPLNDATVSKAIWEAFNLLQWYVRNHTLACVVPALFISGAIITFLSQASVMKYLGPKSNKWLAYSVASVAGVILAVCSCSVLPMFAGIYSLGAGLGPACSFLYSGPAINILAIFLTGRVLGWEIGLARAIGSIVFAFGIGFLMAWIFRKSESQKAAAAEIQMPEEEKSTRPLWQTSAYMACMMLFLIFSDWFNPGNVIIHTAKGQQIHGILLEETYAQLVIQLDQDTVRYQLGEQWTLDQTKFQDPGMETVAYKLGNKWTLDKAKLPDYGIQQIETLQTWVTIIHQHRWYLAGFMGFLVVLMVWRWFSKDEVRLWFSNTWDFAKMLVPILFGGVFLVGFIGALIPEKQVAALVGDNSIQANLVASVVGALFYFATLTEVPILQSLMQLGMHKGPALTLLLAGPALSLPSMIAIWRIMGAKKTLVFVGIVMLLSAFVGFCFGAL